jgi:hypothetical protein
VFLWNIILSHTARRTQPLNITFVLNYVNWVVLLPEGRLCNTVHVRSCVVKAKFRQENSALTAQAGVCFGGQLMCSV